MSGFISVVAILALMTLIGAGVVWLLIAGLLWAWRRSRGLNVTACALLRATFLTPFCAPSVYGHAGPGPAAFFVFVVPRSDRLAYGVIPLIITWTVLVPVFFASERRRRTRARLGLPM